MKTRRPTAAENAASGRLDLMDTRLMREVLHQARVDLKDDQKELKDILRDIKAQPRWVNEEIADARKEFENTVRDIRDNDKDDRKNWREQIRDLKKAIAKGQAKVDALLRQLSK